MGRSQAAAVRASAAALLEPGRGCLLSRAAATASESPGSSNAVRRGGLGGHAVRPPAGAGSVVNRCGGGWKASWQTRRPPPGWATAERIAANHTGSDAPSSPQPAQRPSDHGRRWPVFSPYWAKRSAERRPRSSPPRRLGNRQTRAFPLVGTRRPRSCYWPGVPRVDDAPMRSRHFGFSVRRIVTSSTSVRPGGSPAPLSSILKLAR